MGRATLVAPYRAHARLSCPSSRPHRPVADTAHSLLAMEEGEWLRGWWDGFFRRNAPHWVLRGLLSDVWFQDEPVLRAVRNLVGGSRALTQLDQY